MTKISQFLSKGGVVIFGIFIVFKLNYAPLPEKKSNPG